MKIKKRKIRYKNIFLVILLLSSLFLFLYSLGNILGWFKDNKNTKNEIEIIDKSSDVLELDDSEKTEIVNQKEENKSSPYWDYIKMKLIDVDLNELKSINLDTKGWIQLKGTNINYPFVQAKDNNYYLNHSFDKTYNTAGWVFADYRNNFDGNDKNTILYAHGRLDTTMFGSLKNILKSNWYKNKNNHIIKMSTEKENTLWQVFSVYHIPATDDYIQVNFISDEDFMDLINKLLKRSVYNFNTSIDANDKILTLSTCYNHTQRVVMHAKLIKREVK